VSRILFADDDPQQVKMYKMLLESLGHEVAVALDSDEAAREAERGWADVLILDLRIPVCEIGLALIRDLRRLGCSKPVVILSGWPDELYGTPEEKLISRILVKPVPIADLRATIDELS
jgi:DNA-binding response OmpR family regulator